MVAVNPEVFEGVFRELGRRPGITPGVLFQLALHLDPALESLNLRQFSSLYVLPAKQRLTAENRRTTTRRGARRSTRASAGPRRQQRRPGESVTAMPPVEPAVVRPPPDPPAPAPSPPAAASAAQDVRPSYDLRRIRAALLAFALELAAADTQVALVEAFQGLDRHVDRVLPSIV